MDSHAPSSVGDKDPSAHGLSALAEEILERFRQAWQSGQEPLLHNYLPASPELRKVCLSRLVALEMDLAASSGKPINVEDYLARYPELLSDPALRGALPTVSVGHATLAGDGGPQPGIPAWNGSAGSCRFQSLRPHARGGLGQVSLAWDQELRREVALKEILPEYALRTEARTRFVREAEITGRLEHPNIVPVYGLGAHPDGRPYYAMRFVRGESLREAIERFHQAAQPKPAPAVARKPREGSSHAAAPASQAASSVTSQSSVQPSRHAQPNQGSRAAALPKSSKEGKRRAHAEEKEDTAGTSLPRRRARPLAQEPAESPWDPERLATAALGLHTDESARSGALQGVSGAADAAPQAPGASAPTNAQGTHSVKPSLTNAQSVEPQAVGPEASTASQMTPTATAHESAANAPAAGAPATNAPAAISQPAIKTVAGTSRVRQFRELLGRFIDVCNAVEFAHSRGILHRDLKPGNVILGKYGETLVVDWGLAKSMAQDSGETPPQSSRPLADAGDYPTGTDMETTRSGTVLGTPAYASPEQVLGRLDAVGPASDVYSLGATLYMLLTGRSAFLGRDLSALQTAISNGIFPRPRKIKPEVPKPLESICLKAMAVDPKHRYASCQALSDDLERYLADEPVAAHKESITERMARFGRRHRRGMVAGALSLALVTCVSVAALFLVNGARAQEQTARHQAEAVGQFLVQAFKSPDPERNGRTITVAEVLGDSLASLEADTEMDPRIKARLLSALGEAYHGLGMPHEATRALQQSQALQAKWLPPQDPAHLATLGNLGLAQLEEGHTQEALAKLTDVWQTLRQANGSNAPVTLAAEINLAEAYLHSDNLPAGLAHARHVWQVRKQRLGPNSKETLAAQQVLAAAQWQAGQLQAARDLLEDDAARCEQHLGPRHPLTSAVKNGLGLVYLAQAQTEDAITLLQKTHAEQQQVLGESHPRTLTTLANLCTAYLKVGRADDALAGLKAVHAERTQRLDAASPQLLIVTNDLAEAYRAVGQPAQAVELLKPAAAQAGANANANRAVRALLLQNLGAAYIETGEFSWAVEPLEEAAALCEQALGPSHPQTLGTKNNLAAAYYQLRELTKAAPLFEEVLAARRTELGWTHPDTLTAASNLLTVRQDLGQFDRLVQEYGQLVSAMERNLGPDHPKTLATLNNQAMALLALGNAPSALDILHQVHDRLAEKLGPNNPSTLTAAHNIGGLQYTLGNYSAAIDSLRLAYLGRLQTLGREHPFTESTWTLLFDSWLAAGRAAEAIPQIEQAWQLSGNEFTFARLPLRQLELGQAYLQLGNFTQAEQLLSPIAYATRESNELTIPHAEAASALGEALSRQGRTQEAEPWLLKGAQMLLQAQPRMSPATHWKVRLACERLSRFYGGQNWGMDQMRWQAELEAWDHDHAAAGN